ncbi:MULTISPECIES: RNA polymerase sigma factor [unclassified Paenibacillus]|uniref:RNA polymerase sigma factor n=1 Tax=unclassified Paenibacillus TaxID=185978 RepID=UPI002406FDF7|nr:MULTISPECIES: RNA polymerase sigma factor [unclassified Paenibacillus]MDF9842543.1 RNA polymerase sigma-70 factor (ECF subfamily) [Paenibacillus sp. PastF-2]MDF9849250.1 RNA polymerase sigma-70 factor (ECF subfamily) [Paenibacillus sp. PastM-2]MDF9855703.1 RNA polymerase sigma-70 factor (ECF subfamily) [Paenibacillus sp. PastF-1]MDH6481091.1 RNA polymerase sigma-70 factor (ECF subfamily) [Paenibacillus sp. PastH-2]MDH6508397.1 RNA polymerase sigma-70 factor (ECF subfamily) [Paenibacillus sp
MSMERNEVATMSAGALKTLMETYGEDVWNYAFFLSRSSSAADDIAQETFIRAYKYMHAFRGEASVKTWLLRITRNRWYTYRSSSFMKRVTLQAEPDSARTEQSAEDAVMDESLSSEIWQLVLRLPRKYREILMLHAHYEMSMEELAHTLNISLSAAKSRLRRARQKASECWDKELNRL